MSQLSTNQLAEWSKWNQDNWLIIVNSITAEERQTFGGEWGWSVSIWLNDRDFVTRKKAEGWSANYGEYMAKLWQMLQGNTGMKNAYKHRGAKAPFMTH